MLHCRTYVSCEQYQSGRLLVNESVRLDFVKLKALFAILIPMLNVSDMALSRIRLALR